MGHDKDIKNKLEKRLIQPSSNSWDRLEMMLDAAEKPPKKKGYFKHFAAASVLLLVSLSFLINSNLSIVEPIQIIVDAKTKNEVLKETLTIENEVEKVVSVGKKEGTATDNNEVKKENKKIIKQKPIQPKNAFLVDFKPIIKKQEKAIVVVKNAIADTNRTYKNSVVVEDIVPNNEEDVEVFIENDNKLVDEVEMLLAIATQEIENPSPKIIPKEKKISVEANALLADVEQELDLSFKANVFKKLKKGFQKAKTAVVKRND